MCACKTLSDYTECIREGILADFLSKNRAETKRMSIYEYDEENLILIEKNRAADIAKAASDPEYQKKLLEEFSL